MDSLTSFALGYSPRHFCAVRRRKEKTIFLSRAIFPYLRLVSDSWTRHTFNTTVVAVIHGEVTLSIFGLVSVSVRIGQSSTDLYNSRI
jgi:hypothetical protein